jgi:hypothetical protein
MKRRDFIRSGTVVSAFHNAHPHLKEGLKSIPRGKVTIMTKTHASIEAEMRPDGIASEPIITTSSCCNA